MISLLLVLSLFVTSGVSWALRGVGLTLANEAKCGIEEHVHTDECYEKRLVCGLTEDAEHVHTDECWEELLVCELPEHVHNTACYTGTVDYTALLGGKSVKLEEAITDAESIADDIYTDEYIVEADADDGFEVKSPVLRAAGDPLRTVETIDNIAEGIKFTLFDYCGEKVGTNDSLESQGNNYGYDGSWQDGQYVLNGPPYTHSNVSYTGINSDRNATDDILFLAYGTPVPAGANGAGVEGGSNVYNNWENGTHVYVPDKNSYSGDYNSNPAYPGNRPVSGIVQSDLGSDGYPHIASSGNSLAYLFEPSTNVGGVDMSAYKTVYTNVNHLLQRDGDTGHLYYNSNDNYAYFNTDTREFDVYNQTFDIINDAHHNIGDENNIRLDSEEHPIVYTDKVDPGFKIGFFPFNPYDDTKRDPNYDGNGYNHHFGMTMEADFVNPVYDGENVTEPITFKYSGDDDMWVYVDGKLVLDIGGIHEPAGGMIDFSNGLVWTQDNGNDGYTLDQVKTQLQNWQIVKNDTDWEKLPKPIGIDTASTSAGSGTKWIVTKISDYINDWDETAHTDSHRINMFYLERGGCYSNLAMEMNLPTLKPLTVVKNVDYQHHYVKGLYEDLEYTFRVWEWDSTSGDWVPTQGTDANAHFYLKGLDQDGTFKLKDGERMTFDNLGQTRKFKVVEEGINPNIIGKVTVNGAEVTMNDGEASLGEYVLSDLNSYTFSNQIIEDVGPVTIRKAWEPENAAIPPDYDSVKFKIMRTDTLSGEVKQVALKQGDIKVRTFAITSTEWAEGKTIQGLLKRYGNHYYTYEVEELNVPRGFRATYSTDEDGKLVITNTDIHEVNVYAEKQWENTERLEDLPKVKFKLTRKKAEYEGSKPTTLTVNIVDEAGNPIISYTTPTETPGTPYNGAYSGGSLEVAYVLPEGAEYYSADPNYPAVSPGTLELQVHPDENILVIHNLADSGNSVTIKVKTADAKDGKLLQHHSFSDSDSTAAQEVLRQGWSVQNGTETAATATYDSTDSYGKDGGSLLISNRSNSFNGAVLPLDPSKYLGNKTYTFSAYVFSPVADRFKLTFNNGLGVYQPIGNPVDVPANQWTQVTGTIQLGAEGDNQGKIDPYKMFIVIESLPGGDNYDDYPLSSTDATWFRVDEFTAIEGRDPVTVSPTDGKVTIGGQGNNVLYDFQFQNGDSSEGWSVLDFSGGQNTRIEQGHPNHNFDGIVVTGRDAHNDGISIRVPNLVPGKNYHFEGQAQEHGNGVPAQTIQLSMDTGNNAWPPVVSDIHLNTDENNSWEIHSFEGDFTVPENANRDTMYIYFETPQSDTPDTGDFRLLYLTITDPGVTSTLPDVIGYSEATGQYVTDFSDYRIQPDENSYTNPAHLKGDGTYQVDEGWEKVITLPDDSDDGKSWTYHWDNKPHPPNDPHRIEEAHNCLYEYHIEEIWVDKNGNELTKDEDGNWVDENGKVLFLVSYMNNDIDTNVADNPMVVKNTYIWYWLPDTGGMGANGYYVTGLLLAMTGLIGGYALKRRERRFR